MLIRIVVLTLFIAIASAVNNAGFGSAEHILVIGLDGLDIRCLRKAIDDKITPNINYLRENGAFTEQCRSEQPTVSLPNWATIFFGAGPSFHGVDSNTWKLSPSVKVSSILPHPCEYFPNVFSVAKRNYRMSASAVFHTWDAFDNLFKPSADIDKTFYEPATNCTNTMTATDKIVEAASTHIKKVAPAITFVYIAEIDECSHKYSCFSGEGQKAIQHADKSVGKLLKAVNDSGKRNETLIVVVTDHGRDAKGVDHGQFETTQVNTQWILAGPAIQRGKRLVSAISLEDTSPTILHALGMRQPHEWHGKPVYEAFASQHTYDDGSWTATLDLQQDAACLLENSKESQVLNQAFSRSAQYSMFGLIFMGVLVSILISFYTFRCSTNNRKSTYTTISP